jgi:hypothetical protein
VVLLTRRFKNPDERPQLNLPELRQTVKDMLTALPPVEAAPDHDRWGEMIIALADTLTPAQTQALRNGRRLAASDLSPTQQSLLERIILTRGYGVPRGVWERLFFQLDNMPTSVVRAADPSPNVPAAGQARKLRYVLHIARSKSGPSVETRLGQLEKEGKP